MKEKLLMAVLQMFISNIIDMCVDKETQVKFIDHMLDMASEFVKKTDNDLDDKLIIPIIASIRKNFDIPD